MSVKNGKYDCWARSKLKMPLIRRLTRRTPAQWLERINTLTPYRLRVKVAKLVWWDFLSNRGGGESSPGFEDYVSFFLGSNQPTTEELVRGLMAVGYDQEVALVRACPPKSHEGYNETLGVLADLRNILGEENENESFED